MSISPPAPAPSGWYPDPGGERQWRVWTGTSWSVLTRPYGERPSSVPIAATISLVTTLHWLLRYGIVAVFAGTGLVVSTLAHWPGTHAPLPLWLAETVIDTGFALLIIGTALFALALHELDGHWSLAALVPGVNVLLTNGRIVQRVSGKAMGRRVASEALLLALYVAQSHNQPWLGVALVIAAVDQLQWVQALIDQLLGSAMTPSPSGP